MDIDVLGWSPRRSRHLNGCEVWLLWYTSVRMPERIIFWLTEAVMWIADIGDWLSRFLLSREMYCVLWVVEILRFTQSFPLAQRKVSPSIGHCAVPAHRATEGLPDMSYGESPGQRIEERTRELMNLPEHIK